MHTMAMALENDDGISKHWRCQRWWVSIGLRILGDGKDTGMISVFLVFGVSVISVGTSWAISKLGLEGG
uniref:Uncharacterized protein n=1 Tax=Cannabis sativa TaxID=3483 RepID=A0A803QQH8_CANSA